MRNYSHFLRTRISHSELLKKRRLKTLYSHLINYQAAIQFLKPCYRLCTRNASLTQKIFYNVKKVYITTDCWTSINMESFMTVTAHFLNDNFQMISLLLECSNLTVQHISINLAEELKRVVTE